MNRIVPIIFLSVIITTNGRSETPNMLDIQKLIFASKLLLESSNDSCNLCEEKQRKKAFNIINKELVPGKVIYNKDSCKFMRTDDCNILEMILSCYKTRIRYKGIDENEKEFSPLFVFRFHTKDDHLVGVSEKDFTDFDIIQRFLKINREEQFNCKIVIIKYKYGDGLTFNYYKATNRIQVHCKVVKIE